MGDGKEKRGCLQGRNHIVIALLDDRKQSLQYPSRISFAKNDYQSLFIRSLPPSGFESLKISPRKNATLLGGICVVGLQGLEPRTDRL